MIYFFLFLVGMIIFSWFIKNSVKHIYGLLCDLSDDINEIKEKLGLSKEIRTPSQIELFNREYFKREVYKGRTLKDFRKELGFWAFYRWKWWIKRYLGLYDKSKTCPRCETVYDTYTSDYDSGKCLRCGIELISTKEYAQNMTLREKH